MKQRMLATTQSRHRGPTREGESMDCTCGAVVVEGVQWPCFVPFFLMKIQEVTIPKKDVPLCGSENILAASLASSITYYHHHLLAASLATIITCQQQHLLASSFTSSITFQQHDLRRWREKHKPQRGVNDAQVQTIFSQGCVRSSKGLMLNFCLSQPKDEKKISIEGGGVSQKDEGGGVLWRWGFVEVGFCGCGEVSIRGKFSSRKKVEVSLKITLLWS